jgi:hypothetical protein
MKHESARFPALRFCYSAAAATWDRAIPSTEGRSQSARPQIWAAGDFDYEEKMRAQIPRQVMGDTPHAAKMKQKEKRK